MTFDPEPAAAALYAARKARVPAGPLPPAIAPRDETEGAAVQYTLAQRMHAVPPPGFKIGATGRRMQEYLKLAHPAAGFMQAAGLHPSGATLPYAALTYPGMECELVVRLGRDLPPGPCDTATAAAAVAEVFAGIEIVENRYGPPPMGDLAALGTPTLIADQVFHAAAVFGEPASDWHALDLKTIQGRIAVNGAERGRGLGAELLGNPLLALAWLADSTVAHAFGGLRAGQIIMLGSVTPPIWLDGPCLVTVAFDGLSNVSVTFT